MQEGDLQPSDLLDSLASIYKVGQHLKLDNVQLKTDLVHYRGKNGL